MRMMEDDLARADSRPRGVAIPRRGIGRLIHNCERAFQNELEATLKPFGLAPSHWYHLNELWSHDGLTQVEISAKLAIDKSSSTQILMSLAKEGLIERRRQADDRRKLSNHLTPKGVALVKGVVEEIYKLTRKSQRGIPTDEFAIFLSVLKRLEENLRAG
jgi:MarR family transcriptional regulator for hemolysin